jgi:hypothetical protein
VLIITGTESSKGTWTEKRKVLIITGTESSKGAWTEKRTSVDHYRDRILERDMDREKDEP